MPRLADSERPVLVEDETGFVKSQIPEGHRQVVLDLLSAAERKQLRDDAPDVAHAKGIKMLAARGVPIVNGMPVTRDSLEVPKPQEKVTAAENTSSVRILTRSELLALFERTLSKRKKVDARQEADAENVLQMIANQSTENVTRDVEQNIIRRISKLVSKSKEGRRAARTGAQEEVLV